MSTTNTNAASIVQSPTDYIDKGINELIQHNSLIRTNNKTIVDLIAGLGILIGANLVKNIMVGLIADNQKHIQSMFVSGIGLINLTNATHIAQFAWSNTFGRFVISHHQQLMPVVINNEHSHVIRITLTPHLIETLLFVLDKSKTSTIDGIDKITFNCNVSSNIDISTAHEIMLHYIYTNITFHYQSSQIYIERLVTNSSADKSTLTMFEILSKKYDNFNYDAFSKELEIKCVFNRSNKSMHFGNKLNSFGVFENSPSQFIHNVIWHFVSNDEIKHASDQQMNIMAIHFMLLTLFLSSSTRYAWLVNLYLGSKYDVYEKTTVTHFIGYELSYYNSSLSSEWHEYNKFIIFIGRTLTAFQLFTNLFCYKPPNAQQNTQQNTQQNKYNFDALITVKGIADEMECYHRLKTFMCHLQTISKRQNQNNKINVKTVNLVDKTVDGTPNPLHQTYIEQKKQMLSEKTPLADVISILGPEPDKMVGSSVSREIKSETVCEKYCSFDNLYLRKNQEAMLYQLVESFQNDKQEMAELGIPNKLGILLHGEPGCGKTTTILTIASYFGRDVFYVNLRSVKSNEELKDVFNYVNEKHVGGGIIVFEDIDAMTDATRRRTSNDVIEANGITLEYLLNLLDGMLTFNDSIVVITTNHLEHLDPALYRAGRIDKLIEMKKCDRHQIGKIFRRFMKRELDADVLSAIPEDTFCPAEIIFHLKMYVKCRDMSDDAIMSRFVCANH